MSRAKTITKRMGDASMGVAPAIPKVPTKMGMQPVSPGGTKLPPATKAPESMKPSKAAGSGPTFGGKPPPADLASQLPPSDTLCWEKPSGGMSGPTIPMGTDYGPGSGFNKPII